MKKIKLSKPLIIDARIEGDLVQALRDLAEALDESAPEILAGGAGTKEWCEMASANFADRATLLSKLADELEEADWDDV